jgi:hypothetical protein
VTRVVGTPLRVTEFSSPSDEAVSARVSGDNVPRIRIDAGGRLTWGDGSLSGDTKLYRSSASALMVEGELTASLGIATRVVSGSPAFYMPNGSILVDDTDESLYFRANDQWFAAGSGGGANVTISPNEPAGAESGDLWFDSDTSILYILNSGSWVSITGALTLDALDDVQISSVENNQILRYSSASLSWYNDYEQQLNIDGGTAASIYTNDLVLTGGGA